MNTELSRIHALVDDDGTTHLVDYTYVGVDRTAQIDFAQPGAKFTWIKQGSESPTDGGDQYTGWDRFGRAIDLRWIKNSSGNHLERLQHGYDRVSNRLYRKNLVASGSDKQDELYSYDGLYQLNDFQRGELNSGRTAMTGSLAAEEEFTFDPTGNWNEYVVNAGTPQTRTHNKANELTQIDSSSSLVSEDTAGNMTKVPKPGSWAAAYDLTYDAWNRLVEVKDGSTTVAEYGYDGINRRVTKKIGSDTRHFYYTDKWQIIEERINTSTDAERQFLWGIRYVDDLVLRDRDTDNNGSLDERLYAIQDYFQPNAVMDTSGAVQERYGYEAFGTSRVMNASFGTQTSSSYDWETRFGAYRWDGETKLYQVRHRYLHAGLGRWVTRDPLSEAELWEDINLYRYVKNASVDRVDPDGRVLVADDVIICVVLLGVLVCSSGCKKKTPPPPPPKKCPGFKSVWKDPPKIMPKKFACGTAKSACEASCYDVYGGDAAEDLECAIVCADDCNAKFLKCVGKKK